MTALQFAAYNGDIDVLLILLLEGGADMEITDTVICPVSLFDRWQ